MTETETTDENPLLFLSEQLIQLAASQPSVTVTSAHVSDDDGSPPPTSYPQEPGGDSKKHRVRFVDDCDMEPQQGASPDHQLQISDTTHGTYHLDPQVSTTPVNGNHGNTREIGPMVHKAKRAAASLWMVLHAQVSCSWSRSWSRTILIPHTS
jgi:hypothetical protein